MSSEPATSTADAAPRCANCATPLAGDFCAACGQRGHATLAMKDVLSSAFDQVFSLESRIPRTFLGLTRSPGRVPTDYVAGQRVRFVNPVKYYLAVIALYALLSHQSPAWFDLTGTVVTKLEGPADAVADLRAFLLEHFPDCMMAALPLLAVALTLLFRGSGRNFTESCVFALYVKGQAVLLALVLAAVTTVPARFMAGAIQLTWICWGAIVFYRRPGFGGVWRALAAQLLYGVGVVAVIVVWAMFLR